MTLTRGAVKYASFTHSAIYLALLVAWLVPGLAPEERVLGLAHGLGWFAMCALVLAALRLRLVDIRLAVAIAVLGAVGPFIGSAEFVRQDRARRRGPAAPV
jgi:lauroyl/myristoyl acyltransferase